MPGRSRLPKSVEIVGVEDGYEVVATYRRGLWIERFVTLGGAREFRDAILLGELVLPARLR